MAPATSRTATPASFVRGLSLLGAVALIVGNMVGTSIYTLPASLARETGPLGIVAWIVTAAGYLFVALVYARLGTRYARTGGPYVYAREAFGDFAGFLTVWAYWVSATIGNAGIAAAIVGYVKGYWPVLDASQPLQLALALVLLWGVTLVNWLGVKHGARLQIAVMVLNLVPLIGITLCALVAFDADNLRPFAPRGWGSLPLGAALVVWAYSGVESATVPAEEVQGPERTIARSTLLGYAIGTVVFLLTAVAVAGVLPTDEIASSTSPIALTAERAVGSWAAVLVNAAATIAGIGTLNGWVLMAGRIPVSAAQDGLFFERFARLSARFGTPAIALFASSLIASAALLLLLRAELLQVFQFIVQLAVLTTLLPHLFTAAADLYLARKDPGRFTPRELRRAQIQAAIAFAFVLFTIYGCGAEAVMWGVLAILAGIPVYVMLRTRAA